MYKWYSLICSDDLQLLLKKIGKFIFFFRNSIYYFSFIYWKMDFYTLMTGLMANFLRHCPSSPVPCAWHVNYQYNAKHVPLRRLTTQIHISLRYYTPRTYMKWHIFSLIILDQIDFRSKALGFTDITSGSGLLPSASKPSPDLCQTLYRYGPIN